MPGTKHNRALAKVTRERAPSLSALNNEMEYMLGFVVIEATKDLWEFDTVINLIKQRGNIQAVLKFNQKEFEARIFDHIFNKYIKNSAKQFITVFRAIIHLKYSS